MGYVQMEREKRKRERPDRRWRKNREDITREIKA